MESEKPKKTGETRIKPTEDALYELISGVRKVAKIANQIEPESRDDRTARIAAQNAARQAAWRERQKAVNADLLAAEQLKTAELEAKLAATATPVNTGVAEELAKLKAENEALRAELAKPSPVVAPAVMTAEQPTPAVMTATPTSKITLGVFFVLVMAAGFALRSCI